MTATVPQRRRTRRPRAVREAEILEAARAAFAEHGYGATSVGEIAESAGVVEGTVYSYFGSKRALLIAVMKQFYEDLISDTESGLAAIHGTENRLRFVVRRHVETFTADLGLCRVIIREARPDLALYDEAILDLNRRYTGVALRVLEEGVRDGTFRADLQPSVIRDLLYGGIEHAVWRFVFGEGELDPGGLADELARALLSGIRAAPTQDAEATVIRLERAVERLESRIEAGTGDVVRRGTRERSGR
jgi:AcrR family transcriptional regulator